MLTLLGLAPAVHAGELECSADYAAMSVLSEEQTAAAQIVATLATPAIAEDALAGIRGMGLDHSAPAPHDTLAVILWDEPDCSNCRNAPTQDQASGNGNLQRTSLTLSRP